jgi:putative transposase
MARIARVVIPGSPHHVINRGNRRQIVFFSQSDKKFFCDSLKLECDKAGISIWAYCLMDNHFHLIAVPETEDALAKGIGETDRRYSLFINIRNDWKGHLWQARFDSYPLGEEYLYSAVRYVERNPVRAGIVKNAEDYYWSSARAHMYHEEDKLLSENFLASENPDWAEYLRGETDESHKELFRSHARTWRPLGDDEFIDKLEKLTGRSLRKKKPGPKERREAQQKADQTSRLIPQQLSRKIGRIK